MAVVACPTLGIDRSEDSPAWHIAHGQFDSLPGPHTIDYRLRNIYGKLHVHNRSGAIVKALRERLA